MGVNQVLYIKLDDKTRNLPCSLICAPISCSKRLDM